MRKARIAVVTVSPHRCPLALLGALPLWLAAGSLGVARAQAPMRPLRTSRPRNEGRLARLLYARRGTLDVVSPFRLRHLSVTARFLAFEGRKRWLAG
jgi:hypothetical protein